jgi:hypothetical protein
VQQTGPDAEPVEIGLPNPWEPHAGVSRQAAEHELDVRHVEALPNARWSLDFVHDQFGSGRRFRVLNVIDDVTKECLGAIADTSISGRRVARELEDIIRHRGKPGVIVSDHGTEFTCNAMLAWTQAAGVSWHFIAPGKPMQNGVCEAFNGRMRGRVSQRDHLLRPRPCPRRHRQRGRQLQSATAALIARLSHSCGLRRHTNRNGRSAAQPRPAPPIVRCSVGIIAPISTNDSGFNWMTGGGHSISNQACSVRMRQSHVRQSAIRLPRDKIKSMYELRGELAESRLSPTMERSAWRPISTSRSTAFP